jgi:hypothetical protein
VWESSFSQKKKITCCYKFKLLWNCKRYFSIHQTWHKCWLDHSICNSMLNLKFPVTMATRGHLKITKKSLFCVDFFHQNWFQSAATSQLIKIRVKGFSALVNQRLFSIGFTCYLLKDLRPILASHKSKIFLAMRGLLPPFKLLSRTGHIPLWYPPDVSFW